MNSCRQLFMVILTLIFYNQGFGQSSDDIIAKITFSITKVRELSVVRVQYGNQSQLMTVPGREYDQEGTFTLDYITKSISLSLLHPLGLIPITESIEVEESSDKSKVILTKSYKIEIYPKVELGSFKVYGIRFLYNYNIDKDEFQNILDLNAVTSDKYLNSTQRFNIDTKTTQKKEVVKELTENEILEVYRASSDIYFKNVDKSKPVVVGCDTYIQFTPSESWREAIVFDLDYSDKIGMPTSIKVDYNNHNQLLMEFISQYKDDKRIEIANSFDIFSNIYIKDSKGNNIDLKHHNLYFIGTYDFDKDGIHEVIIGVRDEDYDNFDKIWDNHIEINIFKLVKSDVSKEPFYFLENVGNIKGLGINGIPTAIIEGDSVRIPRNARGFFYGLRFENGVFKDISNY